jgi:hypothetical protein
MSLIHRLLQNEENENIYLRIIHMLFWEIRDMDTLHVVFNYADF